MLKAVTEKGRVKTNLDIFEYAKWGDKNDPNRMNVFMNSVLLNGSFYLSINTRYPADKTKDVYVSFWLPLDSVALFARRFDRFVREVIKEGKATAAITMKDKNNKDVSLTFSAGVDLQGKNDSKFSYFKTEIVSDGKTGVLSTGLATQVKPFGAGNTGVAFVEQLLAITERMNVIFISKADGTVHDHLQAVAKNKDSVNPSTAAAEANTEASSSGYDEDYEVF